MHLGFKLRLPHGPGSEAAARPQLWAETTGLQEGPETSGAWAHDHRVQWPRSCPAQPGSRQSHRLPRGALPAWGSVVALPVLGCPGLSGGQWSLLGQSERL